MTSGSEVEQLLLNGLVNGSTYALLGVSFALIFSVTERFHFAYALTYMVGAVMAVEAEGWGLPLLPAVLVGVLAAALLGVVIEVVAYRPISKRGDVHGSLAVVIAALGITIAGENIVALIWGDRITRPLAGFPPNFIHISGTVGVTTLACVTAGVSLALVLCVQLLVRNTPIGRSIQAVCADAQMAVLVGIRPGRVGIFAFAVGSALSAVLGALAAMKTAASPEMGFQPLFYAFVVAFLAGVDRSPLRIAAAGIFIGLIESLSGIWIEATWASAVVFGVLFAYLLVKAARTRGFALA